MTNLIDILIDATWRGKGDLKKASGDLRQFGNNATKTSAEVKKTGASFLSMHSSILLATAAIGGGVIAIKKLYGVLKSGAGLELVKLRFDRLAESIGTTGDALERDLGFATRGIISDFEALALATDFMALGLVKTHDEAIRLAGAASRLGFDMNQLVLTLTNQTTMRFDALGVSVDGFEEKVEALEEAGHDADEAFRFAFVEQAEEQIERVGDVADTTAGKLLILEADWKTTMDTFKLGLLDVFAPLVTGLADTITFANDAEQAMHELGKAIGDTEAEQDAIDALTTKIVDLMERLEGEPIKGDVFGPDLRVTEAQEQLLQLTLMLAASGRNFKEQAIILRDYGFEFDATSEKMSEWTISLGGLSIALDDFIAGIPDERIRQMEQEWAELNATVEDGLLPWDELLEKLGLTEEKLQELIDKGNEFIASFGELNQMVIGSVGFFADAVGRSIMDAMEPRADIWLDFQADLTDITADESARRAEVEGRYEERRTDIVDQSGERRTQLEEQTAQRLDRIREDSADRQAQIRDDGNRRLSDLERDHLDRMQEIIENADLQLQDAAGRLDARAVARIQRQREDALGDETDSFKKQRKDIKRQIDERIKAEQEAEAKRIKREEENNALRLQQMEDAHRDQLEELKDKHDDELQEIKDNAIKARLARDDQYIQEKMQLDDHWRAKSDLDRHWMNTILLQEEQWWKSRLALVGGGDADPIDPIQDPTGTGGGDDGNQASRMWLEQTAVRVAAENKGGDIFAWSQWFKTLSDAQLAAWIEQHSGIDVPGYEHGGRHQRSGLALLGEGGPEMAWLPGGTDVFDAGLTRQFFSKSGVTTGDINIIVNEAERPGETGEEVEEKLLEIFKGLAEP